MKRARKGFTPRAVEPPGWAAAAPDDSNFPAEHLAASAAPRGEAARGMSLRRRLIGVTLRAEGIREVTTAHEPTRFRPASKISRILRAIMLLPIVRFMDPPTPVTWSVKAWLARTTTVPSGTGRKPATACSPL